MTTIPLTEHPDTTHELAYESPTEETLDTPGPHTDNDQGFAADDTSLPFRKQARAAEKQLEEATRQLREVERELTAAHSTIEALERREKIGDRLRQAGVIDLDVARLLTEVAIADMDEPDIRLVIDDLRRQKPYLFNSGAGALSRRSMGPRAEPANPTDDAADRAGQSGDRRDLMDYLRLRRHA